jgi:hypothetical protein
VCCGPNGEAGKPSDSFALGCDIAVAYSHISEKIKDVDLGNTIRRVCNNNR